MNLFAKCPRCGTTVLVEAVACARCYRTVPPGEYIIAPPGSRFMGQPVCLHCIDGPLRAMRTQKPGPAETKG